MKVNSFFILLISLVISACQPETPANSKAEAAKAEQLVSEIIQGRSAKPLAPKPGQEQGLASPSGKYTISMPIREAKNPGENPVWTPIIKNESGNIVFEDSESKLSGYHNSYWQWSTIPENGLDDLWIYNSDNGNVWHYYQSFGQWHKTLFDLDKGKLEPPPMIHAQIYGK